MANIIVNVHDHPKYEDGDILDVRQDRQIKRCHAEMICHRKGESRNEQGCLRREGLAEEFYARTHQYRFERVGNEVHRTNLLTLQQDTFGPTPRLVDGKMQHMDVDTFVKKALRHPNNKVFGDVDNAVWYGGRVRDDELDAVWEAIEERTTLRRVDHDFFPYSDREKRAYLVVPVADFSDREVERMLEPLYVVDARGDFVLDDQGQKIVEKDRRTTYNWRDVIATYGLTDTQVRDTSVRIDVRSPKLDPLTHRTIKPNARERSKA